MKDIVVIGDLILDKYIVGATTRISPEAPVPIVKIEEEKYTLGGAANVAHNLVNMGHAVTLCGAIGEDKSGKILNELCYEKHIATYLYKSKQIPTTTKTRIISRGQQMIRIDNESTFDHEPSSIEYYKKEFSKYDILVVSDYAKGFCSDDFFDLLFAVKKDNAQVMVDPKGTHWEKYNGSFLVKPNIAEIEELLGKKIRNTDEEVGRHGKEIFDKYNFTNLVITRGAKGMTLVDKNGTSHYPTRNVEVYDVSGAGDTAMAVLAMMISEGSSIKDAIVKANLASSYVVSKPMTYAITKEEFDRL